MLRGRAQLFLTDPRIWNYFEFGPMVQVEMPFMEKDISYLELWQPEYVI